MSTGLWRQQHSQIDGSCSSMSTTQQHCVLRTTSAAATGAKLAVVARVRPKLAHDPQDERQAITAADDIHLEVCTSELLHKWDWCHCVAMLSCLLAGARACLNRVHQEHSKLELAVKASVPEMGNIMPTLHTSGRCCRWKCRPGLTNLQILAQHNGGA